MAPKALDDAEIAGKDAGKLEKLGRYEEALEKYKKAVELLRMFCLFTKHPVWFKQCKEYEKLFDDKLTQLKLKLNKV